MLSTCTHCSLLTAVMCMLLHLNAVLTFVLTQLKHGQVTTYQLDLLHCSCTEAAMPSRLLSLE